MVIVLLCQGLVFQTNNPEDFAVIFFGVTTILILCGAAFGSVLITIRRMTNSQRPLSLKKQALELLAGDTKAELFSIFSSELVDKNGFLEMRNDDLVRRLNPVYLKELQILNENANQVGNAEFQQLAAQARSLNPMKEHFLISPTFIKPTGKQEMNQANAQF
jgi:hypothetical protein